MISPVKPQNAHFEQKVHQLFAVTPFMRDLGVVVAEVAPGLCVTTLDVAGRHLQQDGFVHAGVSAAMADHTAGAAAATLVAENEGVLTTEYSVHFLRAAKGRALRCRAQVLRPGQRLSVVEAEVYCDDRLVAKMTATMAIVQGVAY